jgi:hypothetical protein
MIAPVDETTVFKATDNATQSQAVLDALIFADDFITTGAKALGRFLGETTLEVGLMQGSRFCAAVSYTSKKQLDHCLISPEEMTVHMVCSLLAETES